MTSRRRSCSLAGKSAAPGTLKRMAPHAGALPRSPERVGVASDPGISDGGSGAGAGGVGGAGDDAGASGATEPTAEANGRLGPGSRDRESSTCSTALRARGTGAGWAAGAAAGKRRPRAPPLLQNADALQPLDEGRNPGGRHHAIVARTHELAFHGLHDAHLVPVHALPQPRAQHAQRVVHVALAARRVHRAAQPAHEVRHGRRARIHASLKARGLPRQALAPNPRTGGGHN